MKKLTMAQQRFYEHVIAGEAKTETSLVMRSFLYLAVTLGVMTYISLFRL